MQVRQHELKKARPKLNGTTMFPTTHDITPSVLSACSTVLQNLLRSGNKVLIVSKPHLECIEQLCKDLLPWKDQVLFRFSIGALTDRLLSYWEHGAPAFAERLASLQHAHTQGYETSISCEPLLDAANVGELVSTLLPYVTDTIWIGKMNGMRFRVVEGTNPKAVEDIEKGQTPEAVKGVYSTLKHIPEVRWKESYKSVLGIELASVAGLDV
jgi:DNA repair photolyase